MKNPNLVTNLRKATAATFPFPLSSDVGATALALEAWMRHA
ncbi:MAG: hypothetical protein R3E31_05375 [Chloroflexota bacterium]